MSATVHASAVAWDGRAVLILGRAGAGKSTLALSLMACGARLVADDRVAIAEEAGHLVAEPPAATEGRIEARGLGLLRVSFVTRAQIVLATDLDMCETSRLPRPRTWHHGRLSVPLIAGRETPHLNNSVMAVLRFGIPPFIEDPDSPADAHRA